MIPGLYTISVYQGEDWTETWVWSTGTPPVAVNLTGYSFRMDWRALDGTLLAQFGSGFPGTFTLTVATGTIVPALASALTAALPRGPFNYDLIAISAGGVHTPLLAGQGNVTRRVTVP